MTNVWFIFCIFLPFQPNKSSFLSHDDALLSIDDIEAWAELTLSRACLAAAHQVIGLTAERLQIVILDGLDAQLVR